MNRQEKIKGLVEILEDPNARIDEKDDAAMELENFDDDIALQGLIRCALDPNMDETVQETCGQSTAHIWIRRNKFDKEIYEEMAGYSRAGAYFCIEDCKPEWLKEYDIKIR